MIPADASPAAKQKMMNLIEMREAAIRGARGARGNKGGLLP